MYQHIDEMHVIGLIRELTGDVSACIQFIESFSRAWEGRIARILDALERDDPEDAMAALLSLYSSSAMIGAKMLSTAALELHGEIKDTHQISRGGVGRLAVLGAATCDELMHLTRKLTPAAEVAQRTA